MAGMQEIEDAVGEDDAPAGGALAGDERDRGVALRLEPPATALAHRADFSTSPGALKRMPGENDQRWRGR